MPRRQQLASSRRYAEMQCSPVEEARDELGLPGLVLVKLQYTKKAGRIQAWCRCHAASTAAEPTTQAAWHAQAQSTCQSVYHAQPTWSAPNVETQGLMPPVPTAIRYLHTSAAASSRHRCLPHAFPLPHYPCHTTLATVPPPRPAHMAAQKMPICPPVACSPAAGCSALSPAEAVSMARPAM